MVAPSLGLPAGQVPDGKLRCCRDDPGIERDQRRTANGERKGTCGIRCGYRIELLHPPVEREPGKVKTDLVREREREVGVEPAVGDKRCRGSHHRLMEKCIEWFFKPETAG